MQENANELLKAFILVIIFSQVNYHINYIKPKTVHFQKSKKKTKDM